MVDRAELMPLPRESSLDAGTDSIAVGVHVGADRQAIDHGIFVPEIDATLEIDAASRIFGAADGGNDGGKSARASSWLRPRYS